MLARTLQCYAFASFEEFQQVTQTVIGYTANPGAKKYRLKVLQALVAKLLSMHGVEDHAALKRRRAAQASQGEAVEGEDEKEMEDEEEEKAPAASGGFRMQMHELASAIKSTLPEILVSLKESNPKHRKIAEGCFVDLALLADSIGVFSDYLSLLLAGLGGRTKYTISSTVNALVVLIHEFRTKMEEAHVRKITEIVLLLLKDDNSQVVKSAFRFLKVGLSYIIFRVRSACSLLKLSSCRLELS